MLKYPGGFRGQRPLRQSDPMRAFGYPPWKSGKVCISRRPNRRHHPRLRRRSAGDARPGRLPGLRPADHQPLAGLAGIGSKRGASLRGERSAMDTQNAPPRPCPSSASIPAAEAAGMAKTHTFAVTGPCQRLGHRPAEIPRNTLKPGRKIDAQSPWVVLPRPLHIFCIICIL